MSEPKKRNPIAKQVTHLKQQVVKPKKGKGSYKRKKEKADASD